VDEPRTHYQISLTARQAVGIFAGLLLALGVAFFLGLMAGMSGRNPSVEEAEKPQAVSESIPLVETGVPLPTPSGPSRTVLAPGIAAPVPAEPTTPATLQTFEDGSADEAAAKAPAVVPKVRAPAPASGRIWVQAASLQSREEANALTARLSKHGFHAVILAASGPKGKLYRVRVGPYRTDDEAARAISRLAKQEKIREPWIVPEGK
jgi:cell division septation protein DedD